MANEKNDLDYPKLRSVEAIATQNDLICLRDPQGFSDKLLFLPRDAFFIVSLFDGQHSILDIQTAFTRRYGDLLFSDKVRQIIDQLDRALFLESKRFQEVMDKAIEEFRNSPVRPVSHAGISYEVKKDALIKELESLFKNPEGPGLPERKPGMNRLRGLIAPHIDIHRGGICFAWSYAELFRESQARTFVILGISHVQTERRFVLTLKDFDTPLGIMLTDRDFVHRISKRCTIDFFEDEFVHRNEHSVEFQAIFLRYLFGEDSDVRIVPILCSSREQDYFGNSLSSDSEFQDFIAALGAVLDEWGNDACCIAGVDLSHLGQRFGQDLNLTPELLKWARDEDMRMIQTVLDRDAEGFFQIIKQEKDRRNVCGVPAIYSLLKLIDASSARLLRYDQSVDTNTQSVVTFMSTAFYE